MGFNRRKMEDERRHAAEQEAAARGATDPQVLKDAERLIAAWNERQGRRMPLLIAPTIGESRAILRRRGHRPAIHGHVVRLTRHSDRHPETK